MSSSADETRLKKGRSRISNRGTLLGDGRSSLHRRHRDLVRTYADQLEADGWDALDPARRTLVQRIATMGVQLDEIELRISQGTATSADSEQYQRIANSQRRLMREVGLLDRKTSQPEPDPEQEAEDARLAATAEAEAARMIERLHARDAERAARKAAEL